MASEIYYGLNLIISKNGASVASGSISKTKDMSGTEMIASVQATSTSPAQLSIGGCDTLQTVVLKNMSTTTGENIQVGLNTPITQRIATIVPGGAILLEKPPATLYVTAEAGTPELWVVAGED